MIPLLFTGLLLTLPVFANSHPESVTIEAILAKTQSLPKQDIATRIEFISSQFVGKPYIGGALGEGNTGRYDKNPLYRADGFDCQTLVSTVVAMAYSHDAKRFDNTIKQIRYYNGKVDYLTRHHFASIDWNRDNERKGYSRDFTRSIFDKEGRIIAKHARATIDKSAWFAKQASIKHDDSLRTITAALPAQQSDVTYIPKQRLFNASGTPDQFIFDQIPNAAIIQIVRPNWQLKDKIGTNLNISHMGFALRDKNQLLFRQASSLHHRVVDVDLIDYLRTQFNKPTIGGIHIEVVNPRA